MVTCVLVGLCLLLLWGTLTFEQGWWHMGPLAL